MKLDPSLLWLLGALVTIICGLIGVLYNSLTGRIATVEKTVGKNKDDFNGKTPLLYASAARIDGLEDGLKDLKTHVTDGFDRMEKRFDSLGVRA